MTRRSPRAAVSPSGSLGVLAVVLAAAGRAVEKIHRRIRPRNRKAE